VVIASFFVQVKLVQDIVRSVSFFYVFAILKGMYLKKRGGIGVGANLILGYVSATINLFFTMPVEVCNTRQMTGFSDGGIVTIMMELVGWHAPSCCPCICFPPPPCLACRDWARGGELQRAEAATHHPKRTIDLRSGKQKTGSVLLEQVGGALYCVFSDWHAAAGRIQCIALYLGYYLWRSSECSPSGL